MRFSKAITIGGCVGAAAAGLLAALVVPPPAAQADSAPTNPAQLYYVTDAWAQPVLVNGLATTYAYQLGYAASLEAPNNHSNIIIDFGRQCDHAPGNPTTAWGVALTPNPCTSDYQSDQWVADRASEFEQGYSAGHADASVIVVGTNNDDNSWTCPASGSVDARWQSAGADWGSLVLSVEETEPSQVSTTSGDNIETWPATGWVACGQGTENWYTGYQSSTSLTNYDYGNQTNALDSTYWSDQQLYDVSFGLQTARPLPEIYVCANSDQWVSFRTWANSQSTPESYTFWGVLSSNGSTASCPNSGFLSWAESWGYLNYELAHTTPTPFPNDVLSGVTAPTPTATMAPTLTPTPTP